MGTGMRALCLPGVLAGDYQFDPLCGILRKNEFLPAVDYRSPFRWDYEVRRAAACLDRIGGEQPLLIGASLGGVLSPFVIEQYLANVGDRALSPKVVIVDAPAGSKTIVDPTAKFARFAKRLSLITRYMSVSVNEDMLPKPDEISEGLDVKTVTRKARNGLLGHRLDDLISQTAWMAQAERDGSLARACMALVGLDVTYIQCTLGNGVVRQPDAAKWWADHVPGLKVMEVNATHCGFLQNEPEFQAAFRLALAS